MAPFCGTGKVWLNDDPKVPLCVTPSMVTVHLFAWPASYDVAWTWTPAQSARKVGVWALAGDAPIQVIARATMDMAVARTIFIVPPIKHDSPQTR
ncbi:hypothetical protein NSZ01_39860 [Nocardioides szechwanensis]|nr:hypothetical protein NSZ01_39860 [Nocardioides szechwanensis]